VAVHLGEAVLFLQLRLLRLDGLLFLLGGVSPSLGASVVKGLIRRRGARLFKTQWSVSGSHPTQRGHWCGLRDTLTMPHTLILVKSHFFKSVMAFRSSDVMTERQS
jgi:hypothetical protein